MWSWLESLFRNSQPRLAYAYGGTSWGVNNPPQRDPAPVPTLLAHCDIPCGIYSPSPAALAAKTVWTLTKKIIDLPTPSSGADSKEVIAYHNTASRMIEVKEEHAELCKKELEILWSDYFKPEHISMFPQLHQTFWAAVKLCSKSKQNVDLEAAESLMAAADEIAQMFDKAEAAKKAS